MGTPIILADNRLLDGTPTATGTAPGYDVLNVRDLRQFTYWKDSSAGSARAILVDCGQPKTADTVAMIGHNFGTGQSAFDVEVSSNGTNWSQVLAPVSPSNDKAILKTFPKQTARFWLFGYSSPSIPAQISILMLGERITFPYPPQTPFAPESVKVEAEATRSKTGQLLGAVVRYKPFSISPRWTNLPRAWVETTYQAFIENYASELKPFFWAWDLENYPADVRFVTIDPDAAQEAPVSVLGYYDSISLPMIGVRE